MDRLPTRVNRADSEYQMRKEHNLALISTLRERLDTASNGGGGKYVDRHRGRGKLLPGRIERIMTPELHFWNYHHLRHMACMMVGLTVLA